MLFKIFKGTKLLHNTLFYVYYKTCIQQKSIVATSDDVICRNYNIQSRNYDIQTNKKSLNNAIH